MAVQIQLRRGTASQWTSANPILAEGEMGVELDTGKWKFGNGTSTWSILAYGSGAALLDGDKGDISVSNTGTTWLIDAGAVTYAKMQAASTTSRVLGASSTSTTIQELTLGTGLSLSGTTLSATGATVADADYGNITVSGTGTVWTIDNGVVTYAKMQAASTNSKVIGSSSTSTTLTELTLGTGLSLSGTTLTATGGVTDGDKGDITVSSSGASWVIDSGAVTYAKLQTASTNSKLLGTSSTSTTFAELTLGTGLSLSGTTLTATAVGLTDGDKGDITVSATGSSWVIDNQAVTYAKIQNVSATDKLLGRSSAGAGSVEEITCTAAGRALLDDADATAQRTTLGLGTLATQSGTFSGTSSGTNTGDQTITLTGDVTGSGTGSFGATIANDAVTNAKLANVSTATIKGRVSASTGDPEDLTGTQATTLLDVFTSSLKGLAPSSGGGTSNFLRADGTWAAPSGGGTSAQVDTYTTTGTVHTWSKPSGAKMVTIIAYGAGGGGGGGAGNASAVNRTGGGGGGGGACSKLTFSANDLPSSLYVIVGAGGTGGASQTVGVAGGNSTVATNNSNPPSAATSLCLAGGGGGGGPGGTGDIGGGGGGGTGGQGTTFTGTTGVSGGLPATSFASSAIGGQGGGGGYGNSQFGGRAEWGGGGGGNMWAPASFRGAGGGSMYGGGGGGCGTGLSSAGAVQGGTGGGPSGYYVGGGAVAARTTSLPGGDGQASSNGTAGLDGGTTYPAGGGGGGGGANNAGTGYTGGAGGFPCGGGGGGGASSSTGGTGGAGANGKVVIITLF